LLKPVPVQLGETVCALYALGQGTPEREYLVKLFEYWLTDVTTIAQAKNARGEYQRLARLLAEKIKPYIDLFRTEGPELEVEALEYLGVDGCYKLLEAMITGTDPNARSTAT
jgi:hypothetical protein